MYEFLSDRLNTFLRAKRTISRRSENTLDWYQRQLEPWFVWLDANGIGEGDWLDPDLLELYLSEEAERPVLDSTVAARYKAIRAFLRWQKRRRLISGDLPTDLVETPVARSRRPRVADFRDIDATIENIRVQASATWLDYRDVLILQSMRSTGIRVEELTNVQTWHVDMSDGFLYIESGKGDKDRIVPFDRDFRRAFTAYILNRPPCREAGELLFFAANGHRQPVGPMTTNSVRQVIRRRCAAAGVPYFNPHSVRHAWAIGRLNNGMQLSAVSAALGHTSPAFTARVYAKWVKAGLRREYDLSGS